MITLHTRLYATLLAFTWATLDVGLVMAQSSDDAVADTPQANLVLWSGLVGIALPAVLAVVMQTKWTSTLKGLVAFIACLLASGGTVWFQGDFGDGTDMATALLLVFTAAMGSYQLYWKPSGIAPAIERSTNLG